LLLNLRARDQLAPSVVLAYTNLAIACAGERALLVAERGVAQLFCPTFVSDDPLPGPSALKQFSTGRTALFDPPHRSRERVLQPALEPKIDAGIEAIIGRFAGAGES
jgi:hypothetical protein